MGLGERPGKISEAVLKCPILVAAEGDEADGSQAEGNPPPHLGGYNS
jgi:hypothetical protein